MSRWKFSVRFNPFLDYKTRFSSRVSNIIQWLYHNARIKTRCVRWRLTRGWSSTACVMTGALWAKRGERGILRKVRNECEALFFSSPRFAQNATFASVSLGSGSALEEKRKKIDERSESFLAFFAPWEAWSQASLAWFIRSHKAPVSYAGYVIHYTEHQLTCWWVTIRPLSGGEGQGGPPDPTKDIKLSILSPLDSEIKGQN